MRCLMDRGVVLESSGTPTMKLFLRKIVNGQKALTILQENIIVDVRLGPKYACVLRVTRYNWE